MSELGAQDDSCPQPKSLAESPDISEDSFLDKSPLTTYSEPEHTASSRKSLVRRMSLQIERKLCPDVSIGGRISEVEHWPSSMADRQSTTSATLTNKSEFPSTLPSEPTPNTNIKASRLSTLQIGTPNFKKSLKALFGPESAFSDQLQHPVPSPSPGLRRSAVSASAGKKPPNKAANFPTTHRQVYVPSLRQSCTREDVQVVLFTAADMLTASAANANRKLQSDASSKATTETFTSYRLFELAERVSNGLSIEAESDFEIVAGFLRLLGVVPNFLEEGISKNCSGRDGSKFSPCACCPQNSFGLNQSLALLSKDLMNEAVETDNVMAMTIAKAETSYPTLADVDEISISARYQEAVYSAPKSPKEGWLSIKEDSDDWVDVFVSVNSKEVKMLLSSLDATTYVVPVKACSATFQKIPVSSCSMYTFVITVTDKREYVLGSSNLKDLQDWVGRITNYSKEEDTESLPISSHDATIHIHISDGQNHDIVVTKPINLSIHEIKLEALNRCGLIEFIDRYDLVAVDSDDGKNSKHYRNSTNAAKKNPLDSETRRPEFQNIPLDRLFGDELTSSTLEQPLRFGLSRKELISWTICVEVPDRKVSRKVLVNVCTTVADVKEIIAIMEDFSAETLCTYSLMYNYNVLNPGATLDPWNSSAPFSFSKSSATIEVASSYSNDFVPGIFSTPGVSSNEAAARSAAEQRTSSKSILTAAESSGESVLQTIPSDTGENYDSPASKKPGWNFKSIFNKYGKTSSNTPVTSISSQQDESEMDAVVWKGVVKSKKNKKNQSPEELEKNALHDAESVVWKGTVKSKTQTLSQPPVNTALDDLDSVVWKGAVKSKQKSGNSN
ncbi:hypothetical protein BJ741DRAFT_599323 [Chytriomyces cf. hyalinus JEL632]|nr:hypothetical protein BJ741DRAFT_599323 [Chytriomyces cf. hyalinus JEL632]